MSFLAPFALFISVNLLGAMLPGPDFAIVTRYGLTGSRQSALLAATGIAMALFVHVTYSLLGLAIVLQNAQGMFFLIQISGALYLFYLGIRLINSRESDSSADQKKHRLRHSALIEGFLTNLLNPKAALFLISLFSEFIDDSTPLWNKIVYGLLVPTTAFGWFSFLSIMLTHSRFLPYLKKRQVFFMKTMGVLLLSLSLIVLVSGSLFLLTKTH